MTLTPPTYPARPINGGPYDLHPGHDAQWVCEPKYNGWRTIVHMKSGTMFNRSGKPLSIQPEFQAALALLRVRLACINIEWADCEGLQRRHNIGQGCLIVLDLIPSRQEDLSATFVQRRDWRYSFLPELALFPNRLAPFPLLSIPPLIGNGVDAWNNLKQINAQIDCDFYEGIVAKRIDKPYPIQLLSADRDYPFWVKHRWAF